jgi:uncharacterized membrane protein YhiD involved in acid resistance
MSWQPFVHLMHREPESGIVTRSLLRLIPAVTLGSRIGFESEHRDCAGLYRTAMSATGMVLVALFLLGYVEESDAGRHIRLQCDVAGGSRQQKPLLERLKTISVLESAACLRRAESQ